LLVLSANSIVSDWVEHEVETAFHEESRRKSAGDSCGQRQTVLMPLRLDDAVLNVSPAWAVDIRLSRHIGNFSRWRDPVEYKSALDTLLKALLINQ
jgi:hypothetical protein